jgi:predicted esterase
MSGSRLLVALLALAAVAAGQEARSWCDPDTDCFYLPASAGPGPVPALVVLSCNGALPVDLDTVKLVGDSLGWAMASCHATRNHRDLELNDADIIRTLDKLLDTLPVDPGRVFIFGFSGQGVQALAEMFLHPERFRGVVSVCGHRGTLGLARDAQFLDNLAVLITREQDWNRGENEQLAAALNGLGVPAELRVTPGEHEPGPALELLDACRWLAGMSAD